MSTESFSLYGVEVQAPVACGLDPALPRISPGDGVAPFGRLRLERQACPEPAGPLTRIELGSGHAEALTLETDGDFGANPAGQFWSLAVAGGLRFHWRTGEGVIHYAADEAAPEHLAFWFIHLMLPLVLALEERASILHAGAVSDGERVLLFMAPSGTGKSTLVNRFLRAGYALFADDKLPLVHDNGRWTAVPSHPYHRPYRATLDMGRRAEVFAPSPQPVRAVYFLNRQSPEVDILIEPVTGRVAMALLLESHLFQLSFLRRKGLPWLAALLENVPAYGVTLPTDLDALDDVVTALLDHRPRAGGAGPG